MKKKIGLAAVAGMIMALSWTGVVFAQQTKAVSMPKTAVPQKSMLRTQAPQLRTSMFPPMWEVYQAIKEKTVTATSDGGIVVILGNQMIKYDKDLNIIKETELKVDLDKMRNSMMAMMAKNSAMPANSSVPAAVAVTPDLKK